MSEVRCWKFLVQNKKSEQRIYHLRTSNIRHLTLLNISVSFQNLFHQFMAHYIFAAKVNDIDPFNVP
jgi:hypothetical protein